MNSFGAKSTLSVDGREYEIFRLDALQAKFDVARLPFSLKVLLENLLRNEDGRTVDGRRHRGAREVGRRQDEPSREIAFRPAARPAPGLHRRARGRRPRRDARRDGRPRRRPDADQPAPAGRARDRPLGAGRRVRHAAARSASTPSCEFQRNRERYAFLRWGQKAFRQLPRRAARHRASCHQVNLEYLARVVFGERGRRREHAGLPRHARRHRLAHDDDQRPRRARLGRRRDRGRGGDARASRSRC